MTQEQLAMLLGVSRQSVTKWESERAYPEMDKLIKMCGIFGCTLDDLVQGDLTKPASPLRVGLASDMPDASLKVQGEVSCAAAGSAGACAAAAGSAEGAASGASASETSGACTGAAAVPAASAPVGPCVAAANPANPYAAVAGVGVPGVQQDVFGYDEHMRSFAWKIATGVFFILIGVAAAAFFGADQADVLRMPASDTLGGIMVFVGVAAGLAFIIPAGMEHARFQKAHPFMVNFYTQEEHDASGRALGWAITAGIAAIFAGVCACMLLEEAGLEGFAGCAVLLGVAVGVWLFVRFGIMHSRLNMGEYASEANETLAQAMTDEEIEAIEDPARREAVKLAKRRNHVTGAVCGIIMILTTIVALCLLFVPLGLEGLDALDAPGWQPSGFTMFFWLPWPIGGLLCGITALVVRLVVK